MKVGILTLYLGNINYGAMLQAYALMSACESLGHQCEVVRYRQSPKRLVKVGVFCKLYRMQAKIKRLISTEGLRWLVMDAINRKEITAQANFAFKNRSKAFERFCSQHIHESDIIYTDTTISLSNEVYDAFICGSDQIWKPECSTDAYFLAFAAQGKKKIAYAPSIAVSSLTPEEKSYIVAMVNGLDCVSIREEAGKRLIASDCEKPIEVVLDPTFLKDRNQWKELIAPKPLIPDDYIFCYFLSMDYNRLKRIKAQAARYGKKLLVLSYLTGKHTYPEKISDYSLSDVGPEEFLSLISHAEAIFTDSFHGTVFSIIFNRPFYVFERKTTTKKQNMSSRIYSLLKMAGAEECWITDEKVDSTDLINWDKPDYYENLIGEIEKSRQYLKTSLGT